MSDHQHPPHYLTGKRGKRWVGSLRNAQKAGASIVVEETGEPVVWGKTTQVPFQSRPWVSATDVKRHRHGRFVVCTKCRRFDSHDCVPVF